MRWARRHYESLTWVGTGPRWHLIVISTDGALVGACRRPVLPPFEVVPETPPRFRCSVCDLHFGATELSPVGTSRARATRMVDRRRELLRLRAIVVSGHNAWQKTASPDGREFIKDRVTDLLAELEDAVIRDGSNPEALARVDEARREVWD